MRSFGTVIGGFNTGRAGAVTDGAGIANAIARAADGRLLALEEDFAGKALRGAAAWPG